MVVGTGRGEPQFCGVACRVEPGAGVGCCKAPEDPSRVFWSCGGACVRVIGWWRSWWCGSTWRSTCECVIVCSRHPHRLYEGRWHSATLTIEEPAGSGCGGTSRA
eukprot:7387552-Prymnesium_polylepis.1